MSAPLQLGNLYALAIDGRHRLDRKRCKLGNAISIRDDLDAIVPADQAFSGFIEIAGRKMGAGGDPPGTPIDFFRIEAENSVESGTCIWRTINRASIS
jgi:hypothetical protein